MALVSSFRSTIGTEARGCPEFLIDEAIIAAALEFCRETLVWRAHGNAINVVANTASYSLASQVFAAGQQPIKVLKAWHNGLPIYRKSEEDLEDLYDYWPIEVGTPKYYTQRTPKDLILVPKPDASLSAGLVVSAAIGPNIDATEVADVLYDQYREEIGAGASAVLLAMTGVAWHNPQLAAAHRERFTQSMGPAQRRAAQAFGTGRSRTRSNTFF